MIPQFLNFGVEIDFAALGKLEDGGGSDGFGDGPETEDSEGSCGDEIFQVGHGETLGPGQIAVLNDGGGNSGDAVRGHETGNGFFDAGALFRGERFGLRAKRNRYGSEQENVGGKESGEPAGFAGARAASGWHGKIPRRRVYCGRVGFRNRIGESELAGACTECANPRRSKSVDRDCNGYLT